MAAGASLGRGRDPIAQQILDLLLFRQISERLELIADAHEKTFQWIYSDPVSSQKPWDNFKEWLEVGSGCYWICGKAGSGKSTLMKYIQQDYRTKRALRAWGGHDVLMPSYFFYGLGTELQKSQEGLLRSLLFEILSRHRDLVHDCFPTLYHSLVSNSDGFKDRPKPPAPNELKKALSMFLSLEEASTRICIFIDGVDEYNGDFSTLFSIFKLAASTSCVKLVLSSRPTPECTSAFSSFRTLRLQDLTVDDIKLYVQENLMVHPHLKDMELDEATPWSPVGDITERASGVFLWVMLVVKSLSKGLDHFESISEMKRRLEMLPTDLKELYHHMLEKQDPLHRQEGSKFLQIVLRSQTVQSTLPLCLQQLSFAITKDLPLPNRLCVEEEVLDTRQAKVLEGRLRSRSCGLIEVGDSFLGNRVDALSVVTFLHKTVSEFLQEEEIRSDLLAMTATPKFEVNTALLYSCVRLLQMKAKPWTILTSGRNTGIEHFLVVRDCAEYASAAEKWCHKIVISMLQKLDTFLSDKKMYNFRKATEEWSVSGSRISCTPICFVLEPMDTTWLIALTVFEGATFYLESCLQGPRSNLTNEEQTSLLPSMILSFLFNQDPTHSQAALELLLRSHAANPNKRFTLALEKADGVHDPGMFAFLKALDNTYKQTSYTSWTLVLLFFATLKREEPQSREQDVDGPLHARSRNIETIEDNRLSLPHLVHFTKTGRFAPFLRLIEMLIERGANVNEVFQVRGSFNMDVWQSALMILTRVRDHLLVFCDEQYKRGDYCASENRHIIQTSFQPIITMMRQRGAIEEEHADERQSPERNQAVLSPRTQPLEETASDIPAPPYQMDLGPDKYYSDTATSRTYTDATASERSSQSLTIRSSLWKIRRSLIPRKSDTSGS